MKKGIFFICTLFVMLTGFNQQERVVEQSNADLLGRASVAVKAPEITQKLKNLWVNETGIATFIARFTPSNCEVTWFKDKVKVVQNDRIDIYTKDGKTTLVIDQVRPSDAGKYKVVVTNTAGETASSAELTVTE